MIGFRDGLESRNPEPSAHMQRCGPAAGGIGLGPNFLSLLPFVGARAGLVATGRTCRLRMLRQKNPYLGSPVVPCCIFSVPGSRIEQPTPKRVLLHDMVTGLPSNIIAQSRHYLALNPRQGFLLYTWSPKDPV